MSNCIKSFALWLVVLLLPTISFASITLVQSNSGATVITGGTTLTVTISATTATDLLVFAFGDTGGNSPTSVVTNTSVALTSGVSLHTGTGLATLYYLPNVASGVTSVTATFTFDVATAALLEYSGVAASTPLDKTASKDNGFSPATTAWDSNTTATLTSTGELVVGFAFEWRLGGQTFTAGTGFTGALTTANGSIFVEHILGVSGTTGQDARGTLSVNTSSQTYGLVATFLSSGVLSNVTLKGTIRLKGKVVLK